MSDLTGFKALVAATLEDDGNNTAAEVRAVFEDLADSVFFIADGFGSITTTNTVDGDNDTIIYLDATTGTLAKTTVRNMTGNKSGERTSSTSITITKSVTVFTGSTAATATLPAGNTTNIWTPWRVANDGSAVLTVDGNGTDPISNSDPYVLLPGGRATFIWDGTNWVDFG